MLDWLLAKVEDEMTLSKRTSFAFSYMNMRLALTQIDILDILLGFCVREDKTSGPFPPPSDQYVLNKFYG